MQRVPEPELMDSAEQTQAYAGADFDEANRLFADTVVALLDGDAAGLEAVDLGCGPADIPIRLARRLPGLHIDAVDAGPNMLLRAREAVTAAGLSDRIRLIEARLPSQRLTDGAYDAVLSNSLLHHLPNPMALWTSVRDCAKPGAAVVVMDLLRPPDEAAARALVETYAADAPDVLREDFYNSLCAAYEKAEIADQLARAGLAGLELEQPTDRHWLVKGRLQH